MNLNEIQDLIKFVAKSGVSEVEIEQKDFKICIKAEKAKAEQQIIVQAAAPAPVAAAPAPVATAPVATTPAEAAAPANDDAKYITVKSPMIGTFYRSGTPENPPFVSVGDKVSKGQVVCIIEAMKLFNEIESEISGLVSKILVNNASPVEYGQPLILIKQD